MFDLGARFEWLQLPPEVSRALDLPAVRERAACERCARCDWLGLEGERACRNCGAVRDARGERAERVQIEPPELSALPAATLLGGGASADADVLRALVELETARAAPGVDRLATLADFPLPPYEHQARAAQRVLLEFPRGAILADAPGLGKTVEAALVLRELRARGECSRALVVCAPSSLRRWQDELAAHAGERLDELAQPGDVACAEIAAVTHARLARAPLGDALRAVHWDLVIVDDAPALGASGARYRAVRELDRTRTLLLTAEPARDGLEALRALCDLVRPGALGTARQFRRAHVRRDDARAPRDRAELRDALASVLIRADRADALHDLPGRAVARCGFAPSPRERALSHALSRWAHAARHRAEHSAALRALLAELEARARSSPAALRAAADDASSRTTLTAALRTSASAIAREAREIPDDTRAETLVEVLRARRDEGPALVFTRYPETARSLCEHLQRAGITAALASARAAELSRARAAGGATIVVDDAEGETLPHTFAVHHDLPARHEVLDRRVARLQRLGSTDVVTEVFLCADGTQDETVLRALATGGDAAALDATDRMLADLEREAALAQRVVRAWHHGARDDASTHSVESHVDEGVALPLGVKTGVRGAREGGG